MSAQTRSQTHPPTTQPANQQQPATSHSIAKRDGHSKDGKKWDGLGKDGNCCFCRSPGHGKFTCPVRAAQRDIICELCNIKGHSRAYCHSRDRAAHQADTTPTFSFMVEAPTTPEAHTNSTSGATALLDSGANTHVINSTAVHLLQDKQPLAVASQIKTSSPGGVVATHSGTLQAKVNGTTLSLSNTLFAALTTTNLISMTVLARRGVVFTNDTEAFYMTLPKAGDSAGATVRLPIGSNNLITMSLEQAVAAMSASSPAPNLTLKEWHHRLAHLNEVSLRQFLHHHGIPATGSVDCQDCLRAKLKSQPYATTHAPRSVRPLEVLHIDAAGPFQTVGRGGERYFLCVTDDYTRLRFPYAERDRAVLSQRVINLILKEETRTDAKHKCKTIYLDKSGEAFASELTTFCATRGIHIHLSSAEQSEQNPIAERSLGVIQDAARASRLAADLPDTYWADAAITATAARNICPTSAKRHASLSPQHRSEQRGARAARASAARPVAGWLVRASLPDSQIFPNPSQSKNRGKRH